ncbi:MAG: L-threonylcarbamoyladenylate synthase [Candidatus Methanospirare jalkutatii]|nr:MAG: L-threonylcarbamoyladenylate synthase [Candidatus Methanospirare jalkutatii]
MLTEDMERELEKAVEVLERGGVVVYPTETVYGLGADAFSERAVRRVFELKGRDFKKPISVAVSSFEMLESVAIVESAEVEEILNALLPGPVTVLLPRRAVLPEILTGGSPLVGVRMPEHEIALRLITAFGRPLTATSANLSGKKPPASFEDVEIEADFKLNGGRCPYGEPSTVVCLSLSAFSAVSEASEASEASAASAASATGTGSGGSSGVISSQGGLQGKAEKEKGRREERELNAVERLVLRRGAGYERVLHILRNSSLGKGIHGVSVSELR